MYTWWNAVKDEGTVRLGVGGVGSVVEGDACAV